MAAFLRLIRIEVLRGGGWLVLAIALLSVYVTDLRFLIWDDSRRSGNAPTWYTITAVGYAITGLLGPNGAGKTTIMRLLATIYTLQQGEITLLGTSFRDDAGRRAAQSRTGYLPQSFGFYPNFTVKEFVESFAILHGVSHPEIDPAVMNALERVDLVSRAKQKMRSLSGG